VFTIKYCVWQKYRIIFSLINIFLPTNILDNIKKIEEIPAIIIHGCFDMVYKLSVADKLVQ